MMKIFLDTTGWAKIKMPVSLDPVGGPVPYGDFHLTSFSGLVYKAGSNGYGGSRRMSVAGTKAVQRTKGGDGRARMRSGVVDGLFGSRSGGPVREPQTALQS